MASTVTSSQSNRAPFGCAAKKSAATAQCYNVNIDILRNVSSSLVNLCHKKKCKQFWMQTCAQPGTCKVCNKVAGECAFDWWNNVWCLTLYTPHPPAKDYWPKSIYLLKLQSQIIYLFFINLKPELQNQTSHTSKPHILLLPPVTPLHTIENITTFYLS